MQSDNSRDPYFPWTHLGLRANPFQSLSHEAWIQVAIMPEKVEQWTKAPTSILQLTGEKGCGKSSTLYALKRFYERQGLITEFVYLSPGKTLPRKNLRKIHLMIVDEAQRLGGRSKFRLLQRIQGNINHPTDKPVLIISTHHDLSPAFNHFRIDWKTFNMMEVGFSDLERLLKRRLSYFAIRAEATAHFLPDSIDYLISTFIPDLREMEAFLYAFFQAVPDDPAITAAALRRFEKSGGSRPQHKRN